MSDEGMATRYQPADIEAKWYQVWEKSNYFSPKGDGQPYAIMIPPPNVTGSLHMGHAFQDTIMDILIRYQRMNGRKTLWQPGSDHAGIATQMVVERQLNAENLTRHDLGRDAFTARVWQWKNESGGQIMQQLRRLGASPDWSRECFTMDETLSKAVRTLFVKLYDDGLIYRGKRLVNWDPILKTAISDLEVESKEEDGFMYHVRYPFVVGQGLDGQFMHIATTRPETILADGAIAISPGDERYAHLVGKYVHVPLTERTIPIIEDEYVDPEFGTGCVKITPAHDFNDYAVGQRHEIEVINLFTPEALMNENAPQAYRGLDRDEARDKIVEDLKAAELLEKIEPHKLMRPRGDRTGSVIEPYMTDQWFVDLTKETQVDGKVGGYAKLTKPAIDAVRDGRIKFVPKNWENTYFSWMENLEDWCISRQLWWGHRIPAWYDEEGNIYVAENEADVHEKYQLGDKPLRQDEDVLDTWFSSALWPFATLGWPDKTPELSEFYPSNVLVTGFDIIFFWVARMVLMGLYCMDDEVPFHEVYIHGLVRDSEGQKMSKSKGNVIDPIDVIDGIDFDALVAKRTSNMMQPQLAEKIAAQTKRAFPDGIPACGTDALRFTFASQATTGRDVVFDIARVEGYRNFCNKLWNAARFVLMQVSDANIEKPDNITDAADLWIYDELNKTIHKVREGIDQYRFDFAAAALYEFIWHKYCDWYLELVKPKMSKNATNEQAKAHTRHILLDVLEQTLRLAHPFMPFITEEIWQNVAPYLNIQDKSVMTAAFPRAHSSQNNHQAQAEVAWIQAILLGLRKIRADMNIAPGKLLPVLFEYANEQDKQYLQAQEQRLLSLGRLDSIDLLADTAPESAMFTVGDMKVMIPLAGLIDKDAEIARLNKEIEKLEKNIAKLTGQLGNDKFVSKAPAELVENTRMQLETDKKSLSALNAQKGQITAL